ncbi:mitochondrial ribosomal protein VAR1 [Elysia marginata]|uniref:Mitochondrial ribosomal protein VAR1 n=1 Tax=Elysia marginata TaxID=1093978 RepID=A0AAV4EY98_9GAST|nr:mitochondrial ribosomal protein VAR1 [Elysia marginata]
MDLQLMMWWGLVPALALATGLDQTRYEEGRRQYELMQKQSQMPRYGKCWLHAMTTIQFGCKQLTDDTQARLSLAYLNCFLELQGRPSYSCSRTDKVSDCVTSMKEADVSSFTTFFTHTQNICYFLQAQVWHERTEDTIARLSDSSSQVVEQLENSHEVQKSLLLSQSHSLENQHRLMNQTISLNNVINSSSQTVQVLFEDLKKSTQEQREVIRDLFAQLSKLQTTILGEVSTFYSLCFYVLSIIVCYLLTSTPRTAGARVWLFLIMTVSFCTEQTIVPWISHLLTAYGYQSEGNDLLYWLQKLCRRLFISLALITLATCALLYKDMNAVNNQLLLEIRKQNSDIRRSLTGQIAGLLPAPPNQSVAVHSDSDYTSGDSDADSDADSDKTYILPENAGESDLESFMTVPNDDADSTADQTSLLCELYELRKETSDQEDVANKVDSWLHQNSLVSGEGFRTSVASSQGSPYNLRPRNTKDSPDVSPAARVESAKSFTKTVRQMQEISEKNSRLIRAYHQAGAGGSSPRANLGGFITPLSSPRPVGCLGGLTAVRLRQTKDLERSSIVTRSSYSSQKEKL